MGMLGKALKGAAEVAKPMAMEKMRQNALAAQQERMNELRASRQTEERTYSEQKTKEARAYQTKERKSGETFKSKEAAKRDKARNQGGSKYDSTTDIKNMEYMVKHGIAVDRKAAHKMLSMSSDGKLQASIFRTLMANMDPLVNDKDKATPSQLYDQAGKMIETKSDATGTGSGRDTGTDTGGLPTEDAAANKGRSGIAPNGKRYRSDGKTWVEI